MGVVKCAEINVVDWCWPAALRQVLLFQGARLSPGLLAPEIEEAWRCEHRVERMRRLAVFG